MSHPLPRLTVLSLCLDLLGQLMHSCLHMASMQWARRQGTCTSRIVEAAKQEDLQQFFAGAIHCLLRVPDAVASVDQTLATRSLLSRLLSRSVCSMHQLLRLRRQGHPYKLFLAGRYEADEQPCSWDELTTTFRHWHPQFDNQAAAELQTLASLLDLDISAIECRHALSRRLAVLRGTQTNVPRVQTTAAEWTLLQLERQESFRSLRAAPAKLQAKRAPRPPGKRPGSRGGGGGAWRAFEHSMHAGRKMSPQSIQDQP